MAPTMPSICACVNESETSIGKAGGDESRKADGEGLERKDLDFPRIFDPCCRSVAPPPPSRRSTADVDEELPPDDGTDEREDGEELYQDLSEVREDHAFRSALTADWTRVWRNFDMRGLGHGGNCVRRKFCDMGCCTQTELKVCNPSLLNISTSVSLKLCHTHVPKLSHLVSFLKNPHVCMAAAKENTGEAPTTE
eukprot:754452-Hanusia_phi.AAC.13